ncbi:hypothetical protein PF005_g28087 [Phytophthora fragariae]|uniref:Uncharacterized protein n=1 Tax=Phytophthora fragariae TaxID=53985 RepID=A0A6A4AYF8_9STRA|nr:hypothetical protein PF003_g24843 [Phytophthora fragariae]KAE8923907.1 hypothetical protein PF009_g25848 [Phytophthora fragariae]KAE9058647.1 hypothetical protein PF007_g31230 [Phytophthora fragariae]KAE9058948.1 hypothetical protein PF010_g30811 [Phytophthora fragariae]KAE9063099.1 hypothetical protein PF006_g31030 [Phytophthora fragariae]
MKRGPFGPAITTGGAAFAALGSFLANGVPPSLRSAAHGQGVTHRTHTQTDLMVTLVEGGRYMCFDVTLCALTDTLYTVCRVQIAKQAQEMLKFIQM